MTRYRKKPVEVEAWQVGSDEPMPEWLDGKIEMLPGGEARMKVTMHSIRVPKGAYLVKGDDGRIKSAKKRCFEQTYEVVE